ncbi:unnamed protein product, partial [Brenthis ino]
MVRRATRPPGCKTRSLPSNILPRTSAPSNKSTVPGRSNLGSAKFKPAVNFTASADNRTCGWLPRIFSITMADDPNVGRGEFEGENSSQTRPLTVATGAFPTPLITSEYFLIVWPVCPTNQDEAMQPCEPVSNIARTTTEAPVRPQTLT